MEDAVCGRRRERPRLARLHKLINEEQLRVEGRLGCAAGTFLRAQQFAR